MKKLLIGSLIGLMLAPLANAEIITNSKGEKIELKSNGTWVKVKNQKTTNEEFVVAEKALTIDVKDGNERVIPITVYVKIESEPEKN